MIINLLQVNKFYDIDWQSFLYGSEKSEFLLEAAVRSVVMFIVILAGLHFLGKRGLRQLSVFELGVIIGLGSAAGDPMFYKDVGILPATLVFMVVLGLYRLVTYLIDKNDFIEKLLEGEAVYLIEDGHFAVKNFKKEMLSHQEFLALMRMNHVTHLGQVRQAIIETNGELSLIFYKDEEIKYGLPILPHLCRETTEIIKETHVYACSFCGYIEKHLEGSAPVCQECKKTIWVKAINERRIS